MPTPIATPRLRTARLDLQPIRRTHAAALQPLFADWEIIRHLSTAVPWPYPPDGVAWFLENDLLPRVGRGEAHAWAIVPLETCTPEQPEGSPAGLLEWRCGASQTDDRGFWLGRPWQRRGLMTEAVTAFQDWVFLDVGHPALTLHSAVPNVASARVKEKTGAVRVERVQLEHHDGITDTWRWRLTREAWVARRGGPIPTDP